MSEPAIAAFSQLTLVVRDMSAATAFYRRLGLQISDSPDGVRADAILPGGMSIEWDTAESAAVWDSGSRPGAGGSVIFGFAVPTREAVDDLYADLTTAGYRGHQRPMTRSGARGTRSSMIPTVMEWA